MSASKMNTTVKTCNEDLEDMVHDDDDDSHVSCSDNSHHHHNDNSHHHIAAPEEQWVWRLRLLTFLVLFVVALTICGGVVWQGRRSEMDDLEREFAALGDQTVTSFDRLLRQRLDVVAALGQSITSQAAANTNANGNTNTTAWPLVTPADFVIRGETVARMAQLMLLAFLPLVTPDQVDDWSAYTAQTTAWREPGLAHSWGWNTTTELNMPPILPTIFNIHHGPGPQPAVQVNPEGPYYTPIWTYYPMINGTMENVDLRGDDEHRLAIDTAIKTGKPTFERLNHYFTDDVEKDGRYRSFQVNAAVDYRDDAFTVGFLPIFDGFDDNNDKQVAGIFLVIIYWRTYFDNLLPPNANGIVVVLENSCGQAYTYQIQESYSHFRGPHDMHDPRYDHLVATTRMNHDNDDDSTWTAWNDPSSQHNNASCEYRLRVYPSRELEDQYRTYKPWMYAAILAGLFLFTSAVFLWYDAMVERRQSIVLRSAQQSGQLVSSLFPAAVREQLYQEQDEKQQKAVEQQQGWKRTSPPDEGVPEEGHPNHLVVSGTSSSTSKQAIATLYSDTTILFADLVGFTSWSSKRSPTEVFDLLETLYESFDNIAMRRRVFKVETIGDCYVAATGLPEAQVDHAVLLARFAQDCLQKMGHLITTQLADRLGTDTQNLQMRVGLHSGSTTAGVLRGQKSRFQLFGDTVNVASRMESTGVPGRIHCSQETADALTSRGKEMWLTPRDDKVVVKGKGEMATYWVSVKPSGAGSTATFKSSTDSEMTESRLEERLFARLSTGSSHIR